MNAPAKGVPSAAHGKGTSTRGWSEERRRDEFTAIMETVQDRTGKERAAAVTFVANRLGLDEGTLYGWLSKGKTRKAAPWYFLDLLRYELGLASPRRLC